jgi:periplasmic divalent cation tolerance protein
MSNAVMVLCTCSNRGEAERIATALVEQRLAACVNIISGITSIYRWKGQVESASEQLMMIKTAENNFPTVEKTITELHSYDTPEVIAFPVTAGSQKYLAWITEQVLAG